VKHLVIYLIVALFHVAGANALAQGECGDAEAELVKVVLGHRLMVLMSHEADRLNEEQAAQIASGYLGAARKYYMDKVHALDCLYAMYDKPPEDTPSEIPNQFVGYVNAKELRDGDLLAFQDLAPDLIVSVREQDPSSAVLPELQRVEQRIDKAYQAYKIEYGRLVDTMSSGEPELWGKYISFLQEKYIAELVKNRTDKSWRFIYSSEAIANTMSPTAESGNIIGGWNLPSKTVVLTFDDGPDKRRTPEILEVLERHGAPAYFFVNGNKMLWSECIGEPERSDWCKRMVTKGHKIGNHAFDHRNLVNIEDRQDVQKQISRTGKLIGKIYGVESSLFRPPYGSQDDDVKGVAKEMGMTTVLWNNDSQDWRTLSEVEIADRVINRLLETNQRGIVLFHDTSRKTVLALDIILQRLEAMNITTTLLPDS
jgi:peptidoglycan/xylan/chitin deacetylase (PgdA/CDA1 family)